MTLLRWARRILPLFVFIFLCIVNMVPASASNQIEKIELNVYIDSGGTANIEEIWYASLDSGTEGYKPYGNLGKSKITDFTVSDDTGAQYEYEHDWSTESGPYGFNRKKYKNSVVKTSDGVELCWGISEYGDRVYTLNYKITNFVNRYDDAQGVYFSLMPKEMEQSPGEVIITITSDYELSEANSKIWAFGYDGSIHFANGAVVMDSEGRLRSSGYMTALIKFEGDYFDTSNRINTTFGEVYDEAMVGVENAEKADETDSESGSGSFGFFAVLFILGSMIPAFAMIAVITLVIVFLRSGRNAGRTISTYSSGKLDFGPAGIKMPPLKQADYWREIPCNNDILRIYWVAYYYSLYSRRDGSDIKSSLIGALLLKWLKQGYVQIVSLPPKLLSFKDNNYAVDFRNIDKRSATAEQNSIENRLLDIFINAAGSNGILEPKEFGKWCKKNYLTVDNWFDAVIAYGTAALKSAGLITTTEEEAPASFFDKLFNTKRTKTTDHVNPAVGQEALQIQGLQRFLLEFSAIAQREFIQVHIWEDYLIFAQLLGIADKVREQFSKVYPNFSEISKSSALGTEIGLNLARDIALTGYRAAREGREAAEHSSSSGGSSGGGGSSYSSGGSSAGGSSSGGGFR